MIKIKPYNNQHWQGRIEIIGNIYENPELLDRGNGMTEKVMITRDQEKAIKNHLKYADIDTIIDRHANGELALFVGMPVSKLARSFHSGYEVEPEYKENDWIVYKNEHHECIMKIVAVDNQYVEVEPYHNGFKHCTMIAKKSPLIRRATDSEIAKEKERRWWNKHGRGVWELREGDVITINDQLSEVESIDDAVITFNNDEWLDSIEFEKIKHNIEIVCFTESRLDGETK